MADRNLKQACMIVAATLLAVIPAAAPAQSMRPENDAEGAHQARQARDVHNARGSAATAPAGVSGSAGGRTNALGQQRPGSRAQLTEDGRALEGQPALNERRISPADSSLLRALAQSHLAEIKTAALATAVSDDLAVRGYAEKMLAEHYAALDLLRRMATDAGVILPGGLEAEQAGQLHKLSLLTGQEFNQAYLQLAGVTLHDSAHKLIESVARAQAPLIRQHAQSLLPRVAEHRKLAAVMLDNPEAALAAVQASRRAGESAPLQPAMRNAGERGQGSIAGHAAGVVQQQGRP